MADVTIEDHAIATPAGAVHARRWTAPAGNAQDAPVVLLHDSLGCITLWRDFPQRLAQATGRSVIAYDRIGFGASAPASQPLPMDFIAREASTGFQAVRQHFALDQFVALGHSVGGGMAVACAAASGPACRALITVAAQAFVEDKTLQGVRQARVAYARPGQLERLQKYHGEKAAWVLAAWTDTWLAPAFAHWSLDGLLAQVACPVLALHGADDEFGSASHPRRIAQATNGQCIILPGCGHVPHREQPERVLDLIATWLAAPDAPPGVAASHRIAPIDRG